MYAEADRVQDVTEIIGTGKVDMGLKAMIHTLAVSNTGIIFLDRN